MKYTPLYFATISLMLLSGCAGAVYKYNYMEDNNIHYPSSVSVGYAPAPVSPIGSSSLNLMVGTDMAYLVVPMGSDVIVYNKNFYVGFRAGDQWSTSDNEVIAASLYAGKNFFIDKNSVITIGGSYTNLDLTPRKVINGDLKSGRLVFQKILSRPDEKSAFPPMGMTLFIANNLYSYTFTGTVERPIGDTLYQTEIRKLNYDYYLWSISLGVKMQFSSTLWYAELGKIFPRYVYDKSDSNPIRYEAYLTTGIYLKF